MERGSGELLSLPVVRFAPFLAAGMLTAYFASGIACGIIFAVCAALSVPAAKFRRTLLPCAAGLAAGLILMTLHVVFYCEPIRSFAGKTVRAEVTVSELVKNADDRQEFIGTMNLGGLSANVRLSGEARAEEGFSADAVIELELPDESYLTQNLAKGVLLSGNITEYYSVSPSKPDVFTAIKAVRKTLAKLLRENLSGESSALAGAILLGEDERLSPALSEKIKISGVSHYTAVSGAHFAILASVILQRIPEKKRRTRLAFSLLTAPAAMIFFGATASVVRASAMFFIHSLAPLLRRKPETLNSLCLAVTAILIVSPGAVLDIGFAMSVLGVFGAGVAGPRISEKLCLLLPERVKFLSPAVTVFTVSLSALVCTSPISTAVFGGVSLCAVLTSVLLIPLMTAGMTFLILMGITGAGALAVPIDISMRLTSEIIKFFGGKREMYLALSFRGAWIIAAACAVLLALAAFVPMKTARKCAAGFAVLAAVSVIASAIVTSRQSEIRFVGSSYTSAAITLQGKEAAVFIAGSGVGLSDDISRCLRENGASKISVLAAYEADYSGALSIRELSEMLEIEQIYTTETARKVLRDLPAKTAENARFAVNGMTIASAKAGGSSVSADIVLFHGSSAKTDNSAKTAIFFAPCGRPLPENAVNIRANRDFRISLNADSAVITI